MHISLKAIASRIVPAATAALLVATAQPVFADVPLPIIDVIPQQFFTTNGSGINPNGGPTNPPYDQFVIGGTATIPLFKGFSISYDNIVGGAFDTALASQSIPTPFGPITIYPGPAKDVLQNYRADYHTGPFNLEGGLGTRHRECCPYGGIEWHKAYLGLSYATPHFDFLNHGFFVLDITGNAVRYNHPVTDPTVPYSLPALQAAYGPGIANNKNVYTSQQAITAIIPVDLKHGVRTATTFLWGALDFPQDAAFPYAYNIFIFSGTKQVNEYLGFTANVTNVTQREQGGPFPAPGAIHTTAVAIAADLHLDFHKFLMAPRPDRGRSTQPGVPGGPGGPAPISPSQGGSTSAPSPMPMMSPSSTMPAPASSAMPMASPTP